VAQSPTSGDLTAKFLLDPDGEYILSWLDGRAPWDAPRAYVALSPVYQAHRITVPVMYAYGETEAIPFIASAVEMYAALRRLRKPVILVKYPGQGHGLRGAARADLGRRARQFIDECTR
jgi:dipeptidyl aminopeptidase/acylaminoacyl peptidase